jgi:hypothetical protein
VAAIFAEISLEGVSLNGRMFHSPVHPSEYSQILNSPVRIADPSSPAPYGHRNNQIHIFDDFGLYMIEHHQTCLVDSIVFVLLGDEAAFKPAREFSGELTVGGVRFFPGMGENEHSGRTIRFGGPVLGLWTAQKDGIWIGIRGKGKRQPSGRRSKRLRFVDVSVCFNSSN